MLQHRSNEALELGNQSLFTWTTDYGSILLHHARGIMNMLHSFTANPDVSFPQTDTPDDKPLKHKTFALHHSQN